MKLLREYIQILLLESQASSKVIFMQNIVENWREYPKESHPSPSADYILSHHRREYVRNAIRNNEDLGSLGIIPGELYKLVSSIMDEDEFEDDDNLLDVLMDIFNNSYKYNKKKNNETPT